MRTRELFNQQRQKIYHHTDRMFAVLMILQWLAGITIALWISPRTWAGASSKIHLHVWLAIFLGGAISFFPIMLALIRPGKAFTRYTIATAQVLMSSLFIHLMGGRIEAHFHVFGSLAFLSIYRDWRVFIPSTIVVAADHFLRGIFWPQSVYGISTVETWRWLEHTAWVVFENTFLLIAIRRSVNEMWETASRIVEIENLNEHLEQRTDQLAASNLELEREVEARRKAETQLGIYNDKLEQNNRELQDEIAERGRLQSEAEIISEVIQGVTTTSNLDELLRLIHRSIKKKLYADNCYVALFDPKTELLHMQFFVDKYDSTPPPAKLGSGLTTYVFRSEMPALMTADVIRHLIDKGDVKIVGTIPEVWLGVPLRTPTGVIGVLVVQHYEDADAYDPRDLCFLSSVGDQVALAIERKLAEEIRQKGEEQLQIFNEKLQKSNRELQDFAYVASHDLQEPLRKVQAFSDRLKTKYADKLDSDGLDYLERMRSAANRMQLLIQDLLSFSRVSTKAQPFAPVDLEAIAKEVLSDLEVKIEETGATVELKDLPIIDADPLQMRQLMQNLIGNALKFQQKDTAPLINVHAQRVTSNGGHVQICFADNGIGFDEQYMDKIFAVFQRLHGRTEYEGSGVGLAICRKIVERHNGNITARSKPGEGTTFIVTLPSLQSNSETI